MLIARAGIELGDDVIISPYAMLTTDSLVHDIKTLPRPHDSKPIIVKDGAWIGARATILPGVTIGKNAIVAAGSVVRENVPDNALVAGVPATFKKSIET